MTPRSIANVQEDLIHGLRIQGRGLERQLAVAYARLLIEGDALLAIQQWDCLNPPDPTLCADHPWLKRLVDTALQASRDAAEARP